MAWRPSAVSYTSASEEHFPKNDNDLLIKRPRLRRVARDEASSLMLSAESKQLHCLVKVVSVVVVKMLVRRLVRSLRDLSSRPLRVLAFQEAIPPEVSWISSSQLRLLPLLPTKSIGLLPSEAGEGGMAEEGW